MMKLNPKLFPAPLFCPADRPERYEKALARADSVIIDLEDAVLPSDKETARKHLVASELDPERVIVRVNPIGSPFFQADLAAVAQTSYRTIMVAKAEDAQEISTIPSTYSVIALIETAAGVREAANIAMAKNVTALMWGAEDLIASLGGTSSRKEDGTYRDVARHARTEVLIAAGAAKKAAIDAVYTNIANLPGLAEEAEDGAASGFRAKACIHPKQVEAVREAHRPSEESVARAKSVLHAAEKEAGVFSFEGQMIDEPVLQHAREILARAKR